MVNEEIRCRKMNGRYCFYDYRYGAMEIKVRHLCDPDRQDSLIPDQHLYTMQFKTVGEAQLYFELECGDPIAAVDPDDFEADPIGVSEDSEIAELLEEARAFLESKFSHH